MIILIVFYHVPFLFTGDREESARNRSQISSKYHNLSCVMRKPAFCICESKDADQLCSNCTADERLCFRYKDSTITLLKSKISSF